VRYQDAVAIDHLEAIRIENRTAAQLAEFLN
jgi:hypothetical protein